MQKLLYTGPDEIVSIVIPAPKEDIEKTLGPLTDEEYKAHVIERSITEQGITEYREIDDADMPASREFRNAWVDRTPESRIDICCEKARDIALTELRRRRDEELAKTDVEVTRALEDGRDATAIKAKRQALRDATETLKTLNVKGVNNDESLLDAIRQERDKTL